MSSNASSMNAADAPKPLSLPLPAAIRRRPDSAAKPRVLVVGIDGGCWPLLEPLMERGELATLSRLREEGALLRHDSTPYFHSFNAWTSWATGVNPGKHGIYTYEMRDPRTGAFHATTSAMRAVRPVWRLLSEQGKTVIVLDVPGSYPADAVQGVMVTDLYTPRHVVFTHPPALTEALRAWGYSPCRPEIHSEERHLERIRQQTQLAEALLREVDWDCAILVFSITDAFLHLYGHDEAKRRALFQAVDQALAHLLERVDSRTTLVLCSDHGFASCTKAVFLERWLCREGYLVLKQGEALRAHRQRQRRQEDAVRRDRTQSWIKFQAARLLQHYLRLKRRWHIPKIPFVNFPHWGIIWKHEAVTEPPFDWAQTAAYVTAGDTTHGPATGVWLTRPDLASELIERLRQLRDPSTGERIVRRVERRETLFQGRMAHRLPHLWVEFAEGYHASFSADVDDLRDGALVEPLRHPHLAHHPEGLGLLWGPDIAGGVSQRVSLYDFVPTILHLLDCRIPSYLDGQVLESCLRPEAIRQRPPHRTEQSDGYVSDTERQHEPGEALDESIRQELVNLGYLARSR